MKATRVSLRAALLVCAALALTSCRNDDDLVDGSEVVPEANVVEGDDYVLDPTGGTLVTLSTSSISVAGTGVTVDGTTAVITAAGTYTLEGSLADGQIKVDAGALAKVKLVLNGVSITSSDDAPLFIKNAYKAILYLAPGTVNTLTDGAASTRDGPIHCKTKLSIFGPGTLNITGLVDDGIHAKGGLIIEDGVYNVTSLVSAIKSKINVVINGGTFTLDAGNDGIHGEESLTINGGDIDVRRCWEGIEGATITMTGGTVHIASRDDGVNAASGGGGDMGPGGAGGPMGGFPGGETGSNPFYMRGGYIYVLSDGDGLDINGPIEMSDGTIIIDGPTANNNGALDYTGSYAMNGGLLVAVGSLGMAQMPSEDSAQPSLAVAFGSTQQAGVLVHIEDAQGANVLTFRPAKTYQCLVLSSARLQDSREYSLHTGGGSTGTAQDGLITTGIYSGGILRTTFSISGTRTIVQVGS